MSKGSLAYIFPGQGSQYVGMGKDLYEQSKIARVIFDRADELLGFSLSKICFEGPDEELRQTKNTQPAIFVHSIVLTKLMQTESAATPVAMTAGHSLGEYTALVFAGALWFEDGLQLVRLRGELMQRAGEEHPGTMAAVVGLDASVLTAICTEASSAGVVQCANFNSPGQIVISGSVAGVQKAMEIAKTRGAKLVKQLPVSGAFHSPLMSTARAGLRDALEKIELLDASIPVYANVTAKPVQRGAEIRRLLEEQLTSPVRWDSSVSNMAAAGATEFVEIGPGKVLQGLVKRIAPSAEAKSVDKVTDLSVGVSN